MIGMVVSPLPIRGVSLARGGVKQTVDFAGFVSRQRAGGLGVVIAPIDADVVSAPELWA